MKIPIDRLSVLEVTGFGLQKGRERKEGGSLCFNVVGGKSSHHYVEIVPQPHVHIAHICISYLLFTPFRKRLQQGLDRYEEFRDGRFDCRLRARVQRWREKKRKCRSTTGWKQPGIDETRTLFPDLGSRSFLGPVVGRS